MNHMQLENEEQILDPGFRAKIIEEIEGSENKRRRGEALKRYEVMKDQTDLYVNSLLHHQFDETTVQEMQYAITNISFTRKIVNKLARVYNNGVKRTIGKKKAETKKVETLAEKLELNQAMKKTNRYLRLFKNTLVFVEPIKKKIMDEEGVTKELWTLRVRPLPPFMYDVIPDPDDMEQPLVVIMSDFTPNRGETFSLSPSSHTSHSHHQDGNSLTATRIGDGRKAVIADEPRDDNDETKKEYFWWSPKFNFKTNHQGGITGGPTDKANPIKMLPFINFADDQDGEYWAIGGGDLADGGIKINALLTHVNHVSITQGYGQLVVKGKKGSLPQHFKVGMNHALMLEYDPNNNDPVPDVGFITANAPIDALLGVVELYIALLLSTNNLSTSGFASSLQGGLNAASGIALIIDKAESIEDVEEQQLVFTDKEPEVWIVIKRWFDFYKDMNLLVPTLQKEMSPKSFEDLMLNFASAQPIITEKDKLEILRLRKELGINKMIEILMLDDKSLTEEDAETKLLEITEEKLKRMMSVTQGMNNGRDNQNQNDGDGNKLNNQSDGGSEGEPQNKDGNKEGSGGISDRENPIVSGGDKKPS